MIFQVNASFARGGSKIPSQQTSPDAHQRTPVCERLRESEREKREGDRGR